METEFYALHPVLWYAAFIAALFAFVSGALYLNCALADHVDEEGRGSFGFVGMSLLCAALYGAFQILGNPPVWFVLASLVCGICGYHAGLDVSEMEEPRDTPFILLFFVSTFAFGWIPAIMWIAYEEIVDPMIEQWKSWQFSRYMKSNSRKRALEKQRLNPAR